MNKTQFDELLASVKQMDEMVAGKETVSKTDWKRLSEMTDEQINMDDTPELDDGFFRNAELKQP